MARRNVFVIGASAGGVPALQLLAAALPKDLPAAVLVVLHIGPHASIMPELLAMRGALPATHPANGEALREGRIYVAPPDHHMLLEADRIHLTRGPKEHHTRPAIDPLFRSAALAHGPAVIGVVLTGLLDDGTAGLQAIKSRGGLAVVQDPKDAEAPSMPLSALRYVRVDHSVPLALMAPLLATLSRSDSGHPEQLPDPAEHEHALSLLQGDVMKHLNAIGTPSTYVCPDCHGSLWEITGSQPVRYRCHTGHAYTLRTLEQAQSDATGDALWNAIRALEEKHLLLQRMAEDRRRRGDGEEADRLGQAAQDTRRHGDLLRNLCETVPGTASQLTDQPS